MVGPSTSVKSSTRPARTGRYSSKARGRHRIHARPTDWRCCDRPCGNSSAVRRWPISACRRPGPVTRHDRRKRRARYPLRRQPGARTRRGRLPCGAVIHAVRPFRDPHRPTRDRPPTTTRRFHDSRRFRRPRSARRPQGTHHPMVQRGVRAHRANGRRVDARGLRPRCDEYRQHVDPRPHDRLWPIRVARGLRPGMDAEHDGRRESALPVRPAGGDRAMEPAATRQRDLPLIEDVDPLQHALASFGTFINASTRR